jgi:peptidoglycan/xylan/chitin deacetylase (PgdA/CDA1 family)
MLVICYHGISDDWEHALAVRPRAFERQLVALLRRGLRPVSARAAVDGYGRLFHITFDDAYTSIRRVVPLLEQVGAPATIFAVSAYADEGRPLDVPELEEETAAHPGHLETMKWDELRDLAARGFEIGSHTKTHPHLPELTDAEIRRELAESKQHCEDELHRPCRFLAYPYGDHDGRVQAAAERAGYTAAFALWPGSQPTNRFALPRAGVYRDDTLVRAMLKTSFAGRTTGGIFALARAASDR